MNKSFKLTKSEYELMKILWDSSRPMAKHEILAASENYKWKENYLKKMLNTLFNKGAIKPVGRVLVTRNYARLYIPVMTEDEYNMLQYPVRSVKTIAGLVDGLYEKSDDKEELITELEKIVRDLKEKGE